MTPIGTGQAPTGTLGPKPFGSEHNGCFGTALEAEVLPVVGPVGGWPRQGSRKRASDGGPATTV
jgi:hypothetical protein